MDIKQANAAVIALARDFENNGWDLVSYVLRLAAEGAVNHECGKIVEEANNAVAFGVTSILWADTETRRRISLGH